MSPFPSLHREGGSGASSGVLCWHWSSKLPGLGSAMLTQKQGVAQSTLRFNSAVLCNGHKIRLSFVPCCDPQYPGTEPSTYLHRVGTQECERVYKHACALGPHEQCSCKVNWSLGSRTFKHAVRHVCDPGAPGGCCRGMDHLGQESESGLCNTVGPRLKDIKMNTKA